MYRRKERKSVVVCFWCCSFRRVGEKKDFCWNVWGGGGEASVIKCAHIGVWCQEQHTKNLAPTPCAKCTVPSKCPENQFFANISRSMTSRGKIVGVENVPREISYKIDHSGISLGLPI